MAAPGNISASLAFAVGAALSGFRWLHKQPVVLTLADPSKRMNISGVFIFIVSVARRFPQGRRSQQPRSVAR